MWLFGQLSLQGFQLLCYSRARMGPNLIQLHPEQTASYPKGHLPPWKQECLQYIYILSTYLGATQHFLRPENEREELQFQKSQASFHQELCSFVLVLDAAERCCAMQSPCWLFQLASWTVGPAPAWEPPPPCSHQPGLANGDFYPIYFSFTVEIECSRYK